MISRTASKLGCLTKVGYNGRSGKSFSVAALATNEKSNEIENDRDSANDVNHNRKRIINKAQRRALIEVFVNEYKAINGGKLPPASTVKKQFGGSYYTVKSIVQEIEYRSKVSSFNQNVKEDRGSSKTNEVSKIKIPLIERHDEADRDFQSSTSAEESFSKQILSRASTLDDCSESAEAQCSHVDEDNKTIIDSRFNIPGMDNNESVVSDNSTKPTNMVEEQFEDRQKDLYDTISLDSKEKASSKLDAERVLHQDIDDVEESKKRKDFAELHERDISKEKTGQREGTGEPKHSVPTREAEEDPKKPTLWGNIKSFADGFMKIWRS